MWRLLSFRLFSVVRPLQVHVSPKRKTPAEMTGAFFFRNLYLVTQMDYFAFPTEIAVFLYPHLLNTFFPSLDVLL